MKVRKLLVVLASACWLGTLACSGPRQEARPSSPGWSTHELRELRAFKRDYRLAILNNDTARIRQLDVQLQGFIEDAIDRSKLVPAPAPGPGPRVDAGYGGAGADLREMRRELSVRLNKTDAVSLERKSQIANALLSMAEADAGQGTLESRERRRSWENRRDRLIVQ